MKSNIAIMLLMLTVLLQACGPVTERDLYGTYIVNYTFGVEKLTLNANGSYKQEVTIKDDPKTLEHEGRWRFAASDNYVELENGLDVQTAFGELRKNYSVPFNGLVLCKVYRSFPLRRIKLLTASEGVYFNKTK